MSLRSTFVPTWAERVSTRAAGAVTSTVSTTAPMSSRTSITALRPTSARMPLTELGRKPDSAARSV